MFIRAVEDIVSIENVSNALVPIFWLEEVRNILFVIYFSRNFALLQSVTLDDQYIDLIKTTLLNNLRILEIIKWGLIGLGTATVVIPTALIIYKN
jgi:hypothetical protein